LGSGRAGPFDAWGAAIATASATALKQNNNATPAILLIIMFLYVPRNILSES
jgi:hypothetical protein